jgi:hypothetical protein
MCGLQQDAPDVQSTSATVTETRQRRARASLIKTSAHGNLKLDGKLSQAHFEVKINV